MTDFLLPPFASRATLLAVKGAGELWAILSSDWERSVVLVLQWEQPEAKWEQSSWGAVSASLSVLSVLRVKKRPIDLCLPCPRAFHFRLIDRITPESISHTLFHFPQFLDARQRRSAVVSEGRLGFCCSSDRSLAPLCHVSLTGGPVYY